MFKFFIIKIAFLYINDKNSQYFGNNIIIPTYRVDYQIYPKCKDLKFTIALSKVDSITNNAKPYFVSTIYKEK